MESLQRRLEYELLMRAPNSHTRHKKYVRLPLPVLKFLLGIRPLEGVWFGDDHPTKKGRFWWRSAYLGKFYRRINARKSP